MNPSVVVLCALVACVASQSAILTPTYYSAPSVYTSQYVASAPVAPAQYVAAAQYVPAPNPVLARASKVLGEPGFVSRYVAAPVVAARYAVPSVPTVEAVAAPAKIVAPAVAPVAAVETFAAPRVVAAAPAKYSALVF